MYKVVVFVSTNCIGITVVGSAIIKGFVLFFFFTVLIFKSCWWVSILIEYTSPEQYSEDPSHYPNIHFQGHFLMSALPFSEI